ncbi:hypothetical protein ACFC1T_02235 [Kitasatospora sp. NPDC056076]|uniref:hypothetical protein n=1 Tax=Kitasatospora sp. NPDC056076 TaxID=3345703 RepID=UPI0035DBB4E7
MGDVSAVVRGVAQAEAAITRAERRIDVASLRALRACQNLAKRSIRAGMRARPRWDHRGASTRTGPAVNLDLNPHHAARGGGPGRLSGGLHRGVGGVRRPTINPVAGTVAGGVGVGGRAANLYKKRVEARFPYVQPGLRAAEPQMATVWAAAWQRATARWD